VLWVPVDNTFIEITDVLVKDLFKESPESLTFNMTASLQIQASPKDWTQDFKGTRKEWWTTYNRCLIEAKKRQIIRLIKSFKKFDKKDRQPLVAEAKDELNKLCKIK
jgi:hypothetical protein